MKRTSIVVKALLLVASLLPFVLLVDAQAVTINIVSDTTWTVSDTNGNYLGNAQNVCLDATAPSNCPPGATWYGYTLPRWTADLSSIPGATWIWAPNITGATSPAANAEFTFQKEFYLCGAPRKGTIWVTADDSAEVLLNGVSVLNSTSNSALISVNIPSVNIPLTSLLQAPTPNVIKVKVKNGPNPSDCGSNQYRCNPAGVVLGASFEDALSALPTCTDNGKAFTVPELETFSCPPGQTGHAFRPCLCIGSSGFWGPTYSTCASPPSPPATCTDNGKTFSVGDTEPVSCPSGQTGSASRTCQPNGTWGTPNFSACASPPTTCTDNGKTFSIGGTEPVSCPPGHQLPPVGADGICGSIQKGETGTCPSGKTCGPCQQPLGPKPIECIFGINCPVRLQTTDWFCDCSDLWHLGLGKICTDNYACASGYCDRGDGTSETSLCMPRRGAGLTGDSCSNDNQCKNRACVGLYADRDGNWQPGRCN